MANNRLSLIENQTGNQNEIKGQLRRYCRYLLVGRGLKSTTIDNYRKLASVMIREIESIRPSHDQITDYMAEIYEKNYSYHHIINTALGIERYMEFIGDPIALGRPKKPKRVVKQTLTEAEVAVFLSACKNIREKAILTILAYSGIRSRELCNLKVNHIDFGNNEITIFDGKGSKDRIVHMDGECSKIIMAYLAKYPRSDDDFIFTSLKSGNQFSTCDLRRLVKVVSSRTKITKRIHPHLFRHSLATNLIDRGANVRTVQALLGHAFLETTMIYVESRPGRVKSEYHAFAPSYL